MSLKELALAHWLGIAGDRAVKGKRVILDTGGRGVDREGRIKHITVDRPSWNVSLALEEGDPITIHLKEGVGPPVTLPWGDCRYQLYDDGGMVTIQFQS